MPCLLRYGVGGIHKSCHGNMFIMAKMRNTAVKTQKFYSLKFCFSLKHRFIMHKCSFLLFCMKIVIVMSQDNLI